MLSIEDARTRILAALAPLPSEIVPLQLASHRVLAAQILARRTQPPQNISAMDGYAVRTQDGLAPRAIIGAVPAGQIFPGTIGPNQAVRIFTGSVIPPGANAVLLQEDAHTAFETLTTTQHLRENQNIRAKGSDFSESHPLLLPGRRLTPRDLALIAAANHPFVPVHRRPRVAILSTGDELALPGDPIPAGSIISSNPFMLHALLTSAGADAIQLPNLGDDLNAITRAVQNLGAIDLLITTGGASVGDHDLTRAALENAGYQLDFWKIAMRPGKPMFFGTRENLAVLGLPGNPVSAFVCAVLFALPAIWHLAGRTDFTLPLDTAILTTPLPPNDHRADHLRATLTANHVTPQPRQDSGGLSILAHSHALILRPPHAPAAETGDTVPIIRFASLGI